MRPFSTTILIYMEVIKDIPSYIFRILKLKTLTKGLGDGDQFLLSV